VRRAVLFVVILVARIAHAGDPRVDDERSESKRGGAPTGCAGGAGCSPGTIDPRAAFGFGKRPSAEPPLDCSDGLAFGCARAVDPLDDAVPYALSTWLPASYLLSLPVGDATHDAVASYALGGARDDASGASFGGANGLENRWTIDGAPADSVRTGFGEVRLPLAFLDGVLVTAGGFAARDRTSTGGTIDARLRRGTAHHELEVRAFASWSGADRHRPKLAGTYTVRTGIVDPGPDASASIVATGPLGPLFGGHAWYAAGLAPSLAATKFTFTAGRVVDRDGDMIPDGLPGVVTTDGNLVTPKTELTWFVPAMLRTGLDRGAHHLELTLVGSAATDVFHLFNSTLQASGVTTTSVIGDAIATWRGTWHDVHARAQLAWHRSMRRQSATDRNAADQPQLLSAYVPTTLNEDPALASLCADDVATDPYLTIVNCPIPAGWFTSGGAGLLTDTTGDRPSITADVAHRFGANVVRAGATGEDARLVTESRFTGGGQIRSLFPGYVSTRQFVDPDRVCSTDPALPCPTRDVSTLAYRTRYTAAYVEDTWTAAPDVAVDGGLRWELMWVGPALHFSNELAPRLGATWDPLGGGRSRVWTSMGRSFALLPTGLGSTVLGRDRTVDNTTSEFGVGRAVDTGAPIRVMPGVEPIAQDELTIGGELALARAVRATAWLQGRWLRRGLDTTAEGVDNPGRTPGELPAQRDTTIVAIELATAPTAQLVLRAGYLYGRTIGTWTGAFDPRQGAVLYAGSDYDGTSANQRGPLPADLGHRLFVEAQRHGRLGSIPVAVSTRLTVGSGRPRNILGDSDEYGVINLLPRGAAGRGPLLTQANVRLAATWRGTDITLDVFDVFDRHDPTNLDEIYARGSIYPIDGGTASDLVFLKNDAGSNPVRRPGFATPLAYQPPVSVTLGLRRAF
jgi:hypothetical protein